MRKRSLIIAAATVLAAVITLHCGKSECKKYTARFCADEKSDACNQARAKTKDWSADKCRIEANQIDIENQSKQLENELKEN